MVHDTLLKHKMVSLTYGHTTTFLLRGQLASVLVDTDWAGTLSAFFAAIKSQAIRVEDIGYVMCTHWHPDHMGIVGELQSLGVTPVAFDVQLPYLYASDGIFARNPQLRYVPVDDAGLQVVPVAESRAFLAALGIAGEVVSTPSHSPDSVSVVLDDGTFLVGDLETPAFVAAYGDQCPPQLAADWKLLRSRNPKRICFAHAGTLCF